MNYERGARREKGVFSAIHPQTRFLGQRPRPKIYLSIISNLLKRGVFIQRPSIHVFLVFASFREDRWCSVLVVITFQFHIKDLHWQQLGSGVTGGEGGGGKGQSAPPPPETFDREISADLPGKKRQGKEKGKGVKIEKKRRKIVKEKVEKLQNEERTFLLSLFKTTKICFGSTKMEIFYREKAFHAGEKSGKITLPPRKNFPVTPLQWCQRRWDKVDGNKSKLLNRQSNRLFQLDIYKSRDVNTAEQYDHHPNFCDLVAVTSSFFLKVKLNYTLCFDYIFCITKKKNIFQSTFAYGLSL